jgi:hypothetical protein
VGEREIQDPFPESNSHLLGIIDLAENDLQTGMLIAEHLQRRGHDLSGGRLRDADPQPDARAALCFLSVGSHCFDLAEGAPRPQADGLPGGS